MFFGLKLSHLVFSATEQVSITLQCKNTTIQEALSAATMAESFLQRQREDNSFEMFYSSVVHVSQTNEYTSDPVLPRYRRLPKRIDDGVPQHRYTSAKQYFRVQYFEVIDLLKGEISNRFSQTSLAVPKAVEELLISASNSNSTDANICVPDIIATTYARDCNIRKLQCQLIMLPDLVSAYKSLQNLSILTVTSVRTVGEMLNSVPMAKTMFSEINVLLRLYMTIPITTATAERSFSTLRRLKSYLRSTMTEKRLNNLLLVHTHKDLSTTLDLIKIAQLFVSANDRRKNYFGNFL